MPAADVSDLKDVFDAIDRLCENMRTSTSADDILEEQAIEYVECGAELASPGDVVVRAVDAYTAERWTDAPAAPLERDDEAAASDTEPAPASDMYYTASSEVSLLSDEPDRPGDDVKDRDDRSLDDKRGPAEDRKECVVAGHVAAMRERFESMTRCGTPCPDAADALAPSPDRLG